jgi:hypothetical protein
MLEDTNVKRLSAMMALLSVGVLGACATRSSPTTNEIVMFPVVVGTKTPLYEVVAPNELKLAPGVRFEVVKNADGNNNGLVLLRPNGTVGGYMSCGCVGAQTSSCVTVSDNPEHPSCSGGCTDSEGNPHPCQLFGPLIGPPKNPFHIRFLARPASNPGARGKRK